MIYSNLFIDIISLLRYNIDGVRKMKITLYHGSEYIIEHPQFGLGAKNNDYGRGFYCTENPELAKEWACSKNTNGYANEYEFDMTGLKVLNLNDNGYSILNWLAVLTENRTYWQNGSIAEEAKKYLREHFLIDISGYDVIIGYRADDSYFSFAQDFVSNTISLEKLSRAMYLGKLGEQIVLKSEKAFRAIKFIGAEEALREEYYTKKVSRDKQARKEYRISKKDASDLNGTYMLDIMREGMTNDDPRLL